MHVRPEHVFDALERAADGAGRAGRGRRRHRDDLPRLQGRDRHGVAHDASGPHGRRARPGQSRPADAARGQRRPGRPADRGRARCPRRRRTRRTARSSWSSPPMRRCSAPVRPARAALGARDRRARAARARTRAATSRSRSRPATADARAAGRSTSSRTSEIDPLFYATIEATEEAIVNALLNGETMSSSSGTVHGCRARDFSS